jgi:hypothetical protein
MGSHDNKGGRQQLQLSRPDAKVPGQETSFLRGDHSQKEAFIRCFFVPPFTRTASLPSCCSAYPGARHSSTRTTNHFTLIRDQQPPHMGVQRRRIGRSIPAKKHKDAHHQILKFFWQKGAHIAAKNTQGCLCVGGFLFCAPATFCPCSCPVKSQSVESFPKRTHLP